jgi:hypothetical protein
MNITNTKEEVEVVTKPKGLGSKIKKPENKPEQPRSRTKPTLVSNFEKKPQAKKEIKPVETIGNDRFKLLLSMYDNNKGKENNNCNPRQVGKLDNSKLNAFNSNKEEVDVCDKQGGDKEGIKSRMESYLKNGENINTPSSSHWSDPILEKRRTQKMDDEEEIDDTNEEDLEIASDNENLSD